ncbi:MAG: FAD-dependent thymidylate synthase [Treponema sp.]|jgi:thymidylate synthase (FAD)|nr:FAD-dependent thymidylate synthase [Treponema sp.]
MARCVIAEAEAVLDKEFPVLDKGFVRLVDYLGGDARVVQAARVSYGEGTKTCREDAGLIDYLLRNRHTTPFEQVVLTYHIKLPLFVARQWLRHRTARVNEISGRYSVMGDAFYLPDPGDIALQSPDNKQGRAAEALDAEAAEAVRASLAAGQRRAYQDYTDLLAQGLARELARINMPLSLYTELYWQIDLHNLFHFLELRLDPHAQREIRRYAGALLALARKVAPRCCESFARHCLGGRTFSQDELAELRRRLGLGGAEASPLSGKDLERFEEKLTENRGY